MSSRLIYFLGFLAVCGILATSIYLQFATGIQPCPLCTLQRISFALLGIFFLIGIISKHTMRLFMNFFSIIVSLAGIVFAGRQVWLQQFHSADGTECGVSLEYMLQVLPINEVLQKIFAGSAECTQRGSELLSLNMAEWALACFVIFLLVSGYLFYREIRFNK